jgi:hypothetical protein
MERLRSPFKTLLITGLPSILLLLGAASSSAQPPPDLSAAATGSGFISIQFNSENYVPGSFLNLSYRTRRETLEGKVDLYFAASLPTGELLFLTTSGAFVTAFEPFRRNVTITDETTTLFSLPFPVDFSFGTYTCFMAMVSAGADATDAHNWVSNVSSVTVSYTPLSPAQRAILQQRGNPDFFSVIWTPELLQMRESWLYLSGSPTRYEFLNGNLGSQTAASGSPKSTPPRVDPNLFTPQTTLDQLVVAFGPPTSVAPLPGAPDYTVVSYSFGLSVVLRTGRLSSALTFIP